jgi:mono/diheme cytochrome c family protein
VSDNRRWSPPPARGRGGRGVVAVVLQLLILCACSISPANQNGDGGVSWFTDFKRQPKFMPWRSESDTVPPRGNPEGSVPIYGAFAPGFMYARSGMAGLAAMKAMAAIPNPVPADSASVSRGRVLFQINCAVCHGPLGLGNGPATKYGVSAPVIGAHGVADTLTDGFIFGMIRNGTTLMPTYNRIEEPDRWDIVNYVRSLQGKLAIAADTSHGLPGETGPLVPGATRTAPTRSAPYYHPGTPTAVPGVPTKSDTAKGGA